MAAECGLLERPFAEFRWSRDARSEFAYGLAAWEPAARPSRFSWPMRASPIQRAPGGSAGGPMFWDEGRKSVGRRPRDE
jgi:hypothetical protein